MNATAAACVIAAGAAVTGCSFAPPYRVPESVATPARYRESGDWQRAQPEDERPRGEWWKLFADPDLDRLEVRATQANQTLQAALARLQQARADTRVARADLFPTLTSTASAARARVSTNSPTYPKGAPTEGDDFILQADLSYEIDLWGRVRNELASARASQQASAADLASMRLSIQAEVATDYFGLRSYDTQQQLLDATVAAYARSLDLTQRLFEGGAAPRSDVAQAQAQLHTAQTQAADIHLLRAQLLHATAVLLGENPSAFEWPAQPLAPQAVLPPLDPGLPSALLQRRPDVAEAERHVAAANAQIGVARAAYFPQFNLIAGGGYNSAQAPTWIEAPSLFWSVGPQVSLPLFEGGRLRAQTEHAKAAYAEQVALYRNTVLTAYQDVEDNLAALRQLGQEHDSQALAVEATAVAFQQSTDRYNAGAVTYLEVVSTQTAALQARLAAITIQTRQMNATILLIKALGGGWH